MVELATILVGIVVPLVIGPLSVFCKSLWDRYSSSKALKKKNKYDTRMKELADKINLFYWPVYLKLKTLDRINYETCQEENKNFQLDMGCIEYTTLSDYSSDTAIGVSEKNIINGKKKRKKKKKKNKCRREGCDKINQQIHLSPYCLECRLSHKSNLNINENIDASESDDSLNVNMEWEGYELEGRKRNKYSLRHINLHNDRSDKNENLLVTVDSVLLNELDQKILDICLEIKSLVETNISIIQPSRKLIREIVKFTRYTEMLQIISKAKENTNKKYNIKELGVVNNTEKIQIIIRNELERYMKEYQITFENYNRVSSITKQSCCRGNI